jgi:hypothetical protein
MNVDRSTAWRRADREAVSGSWNASGIVMVQKAITERMR